MCVFCGDGYSDSASWIIWRTAAATMIRIARLVSGDNAFSASGLTDSESVLKVMVFMLRKRPDLSALKVKGKLRFAIARISSVQPVSSNFRFADLESL
jgi:hypothetical protein